MVSVIVDICSGLGGGREARSSNASAVMYTVERKYKQQQYQ